MRPDDSPQRILPRRRLLTATAVTGLTALAGCSQYVGQSGSGGGDGQPTATTTETTPPEPADASVLDGYLDDVPHFDGSIEDRRGETDVTVTVGAAPSNHLSFDPPAIHVDRGTTVVWEWTGKAGSHNVVHEDDEFESALTPDEGHTFEHTFEEDGVYAYHCAPHRGTHMRGAVIVGTDYGSFSWEEPTPRRPDYLDEEPPEDAPDFDGWMEGVENYRGVFDRTGEDLVPISVGMPGNDGEFAFEPPAVRVDPGTEILWIWAGRGGHHSVTGENRDFESEVTDDKGHQFSLTVDDPGVVKYYCTPHRSIGMRGVIVVEEPE